MKQGWNTLLLTVFVLLFAVGIWTPSLTRAQASAVGKIAFVFTECDLFGNCHGNLAVIDADGSNMLKLTSGTFAEEPAWSPDGSRLAFTDRYGYDILVIPAAGGSPVNLTNNGWYYTSPAWSPDGTKIAAVAGQRIVVVPATGGSPVTLTQGMGADWYPAWSPDGTKLAFASNRANLPAGSDLFDLYVMNADGSDVTRITTGVVVAGRPTWSPDAARLAFTCMVDKSVSLNYDICAVNADGSGFAVLTPGTAYANDVDPTFSPDGTKLAFATTSGPTTCPDDIASVLAVMNADGSGIIGLGPSGGIVVDPSWSPDGTRIAFTYHEVVYGDFGPNLPAYWCSEIPSVYVVNADGTALVVLARGVSPAWRPSGANDGNAPPVASFTWACSGPTCTFDGFGSSDPDGTIASYSWIFGDGTTGSGATASHPYAAAGTYTVALMVTDNGGAAGSQSQIVTIVNAPPVAAFTWACSGLTCTFDGSGSSDADGTIASYAWIFGDGTTGSGATASHPYAAAGTYTVTLTVTDNGGATSAQSKPVTAIQPTMHLGDLDRASSIQLGSWTAMVTITVHDSGHSAVLNATVTGAWNNGGTGSCATNGSGQCAVSKSVIPKKTGSVTFTVVNVTHATLPYKSADNHDPDGDSTGTSITVSRP